MFNVGSGEFLIILLVALVVLGPTRLPGAIRQLGQFLGEARKLSSNFQNEVQEAMKDPVKVVTGEDTPKLPKMPKTGKEMLGFAVSAPFAAQKATDASSNDGESAGTDGEIGAAEAAGAIPVDDIDGAGKPAEVAPKPKGPMFHSAAPSPPPSQTADEDVDSAVKVETAEVDHTELADDTALENTALDNTAAFTDDDGDEVLMFGDR